MRRWPSRRWPAGDVDAATDASDTARERFDGWLLAAATTTSPPRRCRLARGDLASARRFADEDVDAAVGWFTAQALADPGASGLGAERIRASRTRRARRAGARRRDAGPPLRPGPAGVPCRSGRRCRQPPGSGADPRCGDGRSGSAPAWSGSRCTTPATRHRWKRSVTHWEKPSLTPHGRPARRCPPTRQSRTPNAAAANENGRLPAGSR